ncbi:MAG: HNH endonuclease [Myxococcota bacterium]|nr:HNH endonuclease [Myxococcota bacterium]
MSSALQYILRVNEQVLVLNRHYQPVNVIRARRAFTMLYVGIAFALDRDYQQHSFEDWVCLEIDEDDEAIGTSRGAVRVPRIIVLKAYNRLPCGRVRFSRSNVYMRDRYTCQYCEKRFVRAKLNLDHVMPRSRGGAHSWTNVVTSCIPCNSRKGGRTPEEANMPLARRPRQPRWRGILEATGGRSKYREWEPFVDAFA